MRVDILVPTLGRPQALRPLVENIKATTPQEHRIIFVLDADDEASWEELTGVRASAVECDGTYPVKTNAGYCAGSGDLVLPTADDVVFHFGWLEAALEHFEAGAQVVGTNDLTPSTRGGRHATMPIVRRSYIEDPGAAWSDTGKVFHEGYHHCFVETELWQLANHRGVAVFEAESVIEHRHHSFGTREADDTDRKGNMQNWDADKALFQKRKAEWLAS